MDRSGRLRWRVPFGATAPLIRGFAPELAPGCKRCGPAPNSRPEGATSVSRACQRRRALGYRLQDAAKRERPVDGEPADQAR